MIDPFDQELRNDLAAAGYVYVQFHGGSLHGQWRLTHGPIAHGSTYSRVVPTDETWAYNERTGRYELVDLWDLNDDGEFEPRIEPLDYRGPRWWRSMMRWLFGPEQP